MNNKRPFFMVAAFLMFAGCLNVAMAQFTVFSWESFESGQLPATLLMRHDASSANLSVVDYSTLTGIRGMYDSKSRDELYRYGLKFSTTPQRRFLSIMDHLMLDRQLLGASGKALYQADFFLPEDVSEMANISVLAVVNQPEKGGSLYQFYRFGILNTGHVFFSYAKDTPQPILYKQESIASLQLDRPGWHRFQIIFHGQRRIYCAVDGKVTNFSPIDEPTLRFLNAGVFVAGPVDNNLTAYVDNLSIQFTNEDVPLPDSPWLGAVAGTFLSGTPTRVTTVPQTTPRPATPGTAVTPAPPAGSATPAPAASVNWLTNPDEAWNAASMQNKPLLILFYAPRVRSFEDFQNIMNSNPQSQTLLAKYALLQVDVNQLRGGTLAQKFNVFKVPTIVVLENGVEARRFMMRKDTTWADIEAVLR